MAHAKAVKIETKEGDPRASALISLFEVLSGDYVKKGLIMNYCPFCGEDIVSHTPTGQQIHANKE